MRLATAAPGTQEVAASPATVQGGACRDVLPRNTTFAPTDSRNSLVQPSLSDLAPGEYFGALTLLLPQDLTSRTVNVLFVVTPPGAAPAGIRPLEVGGRAAQDDCVPQRLFATGRSLGGNFS